jgi:hypothetical protein
MGGQAVRDFGGFAIFVAIGLASCNILRHRHLAGDGKGEPMRSIRCAVCAALALGALLSGWAAADPVIYNTGVNSAGAVLPDNSVDPHYTVSPGSLAVVFSSLSATPPSDTSSAWIKANSDFGPGSYLFQTSFTWPVAETITIEGQWSGYVAGLDIALNSISNGATTPNPGYTAWHSFSITAPANAGANTLDFRTYRDFGDDPNTGLRVEIFSVAPAPEPAGLALLGIAAALASARPRRCEGSRGI